MEFIRAEIENMKVMNRFGVAKNYACARNSFARYLLLDGITDLPFEMLTSELLADYQTWLWKGGVSRNSSSCYMRCLHALFNKAAHAGWVSGNPFIHVYTGVAKTRKRAIPDNVIRNLFCLDIKTELIKQGLRPGRKSYASAFRNLSLTRDIFLFCFCACGMTFVDLAYLKKNCLSDGYIHYARKKTHQPIEVKVEPLMKKILDRNTNSSPYLFPILSSTDIGELDRQYRKALRLYNLHLKKLSLLLGRDVSLTSYVARHSWATAAYRKHLPLSVISQAMGHDSERTTQIYLKSLENTMINDANHRLLDEVFDLNSTSYIEEESFMGKGTNY